MAVTITEILGTDSISGSRLTINSNFLLLENAYNDLENTFNVNVLTGSMDVSTASSGQIKAKSLLSNSMVMPSSGTPTIQIYGTGAQAGSIIASNTISGATGVFSNLLQTNSFSASGAVNFGATATFQSAMVNNGKFVIGASGAIINTNRRASVGSTTNFPSGTGAGITGTWSNPYVPNVTESVIYIDSSNVEGTTAGFFMNVATGPNPGVSDLPAGFTLTLIDVSYSNTPGTSFIATGQTGASGYYTGFSQNDGSYSTIIQMPGAPYKTSMTIMWEPRIDQGLATCKGSWVVLSATPNIIF